MAGHGASGQLKEEDGAHHKCSVVIGFIALPVAKGAGEGRRHPRKGSPSHSLESDVDWSEQDLLGGAGHHGSGLGLQRSPGETPSIFVVSLDAVSHTLLFSVHILSYMEGLQSSAGDHFVFFG